MSRHAPPAAAAALERYIEATNSHDFDQVQPLLHPHAAHRFTDAECTTLDATRRYFERTWATVVDERYEAVDVVWLTPSPSIAVALYTFRWNGLIDGRPRGGRGRATNVFVVDERGRWLLALEHLSSWAPSG